MPRRGILNVDELQEAQLKTGEQNPFIQKYLAQIAEVTTLQEIANLTAEMLRSLFEQKFDPGTVKDFRPILFIMILASDNWSVTEEGLSLTTQLVGVEILKKLGKLDELESNKEIKITLNKVTSFLRFYALNEASLALNNLAKEQPQFKTLSQYLMTLAEGAPREKLQFSALQYEEEIVAEIFIRVNKVLHMFAPDIRENADFSFEGKESILKELRLLQSLIDYHPSLQLRKDAQECLTLLEASPAIEKLYQQQRAAGRLAATSGTVSRRF